MFIWSSKNWCLYWLKSRGRANKHDQQNLWYKTVKIVVVQIPRTYVHTWDERPYDEWSRSAKCLTLIYSLTFAWRRVFQWVQYLSLVNPISGYQSLIDVCITQPQYLCPFAYKILVLCVVCVFSPLQVTFVTVICLFVLNNIPIT